MIWDVGIPLYDSLILRDDDGNPITGKSTSDFSTHQAIYPRDNSTATMTIVEMSAGDGLYRYSFTPNKTGLWMVRIIYDDGSTRLEWFEHYSVIDYKYGAIKTG